MSLKLPHDYLDQMRGLLEEEFDAFSASFDSERAFGLRLNRSKLVDDPAVREDVLARFRCRPIPWCPNGYYYEESTRPGKHPYHAAGLYYIQEPSAMSAVELLDPRPGEVVLDLAAAPGGKTTHISDKMGGDGLLIANEIHPGRAKILSENAERYGITNVVVVNATPDQLSKRFPAFFDKIMLDAPCSGEGMFRKDPEAIREWSPEQVEICAARQDDILEEAVKMLRPGGRLAYSTCTFNRSENEDRMEQFVSRHPEMKMLRTERIWPHRHEGEGHFVALLEKDGSPEPEQPSPAGKRPRASKSAQEAQAALREFRGFLAETAPEWTLPQGEPLFFGDQLYLLPARPDRAFGPDSLTGLKVLRPGLHLAERKKNRLEPAHACALAVSGIAREAALAPDSPDALKYLRGETFESSNAPDGWIAVTVGGYAIGWGKCQNGLVKNHYPKGLRWLGS